MQSHEYNVVQTQLNHLYNDVQSVSEKKKRKFLYTEISRGNKIFSFKKLVFKNSNLKIHRIFDYFSTLIIQS